MGYWKTTTEAAGEQLRKVVEPLIAFVRHGEPEPPVQPRVFRIVDENGVEKEVFAPPGNVSHSGRPVLK
jgi:hypothetical protein